MAASTVAAQELVEGAKRAAAAGAVRDHLDPSFRHIGIGSGSTVVYVVEAIAVLGEKVTSTMTFYPTGDQSRDLIENAGLRLKDISQLPITESLDVCFDGADEVDTDLNLIKGGGACLFQEKIIATASKKFVCVAGKRTPPRDALYVELTTWTDYRKQSPRLGTSWKQGIPIEVLPLAAKRVLRELELLGAQKPQIRQGTPKKAGPVVTDNSMWLIDAPFPPLLLPSDLASGAEGGNGENGIWTVDALADKLIKTPAL